MNLDHKLFRHSIIVLVLLGLTCFSISVVAAENFDVLEKGGDKLLYDSLLQQSKQLYKERQIRVRDALQSPQEIVIRQKRLLSDYRRIIGELPAEKTPLNAKVTGVVKCDGYRIERVIFESRPNHHVTANLYLPRGGNGSFPGMVMPCGHSSNGKACSVYQRACALFALNGFVALIYDPICQGERHQLIESRGHGIVTHSMLNAGSLLVGRSIVGYEAWDGIRSIDYLLNRDEVDQGKPIGMTGNSGGGTQTTFLMALDDRIGPAAPSCYVMRKQRKYETIGPADGCQHLPCEVVQGIDHADYFWMRAPKPTLILAAEKDFFDFDSTIDAANEIKHLYTAIDKPECTGIFSYDGPHGFSKPLRQAAVGWMKRWLMNDAVPVIEPELKLNADKALQATVTGQVVSSFKEEVTVAEMNLARAKELAGDRCQFWQDNDTKSCLAQVRRLIGASQKREKASVCNKGSVKREGYLIDKLLITRQGQIPMAALLFVPQGDLAKRPATVYVDSRGKASDAAVDGEIEKLVRAGRIVLSVDLRGFGETTDKGSDKRYRNNEHRVANLAMHIGRPLLGQRVDDILAATDVLSERADVETINLVGLYDAGPVALHAGALDARFSSVSVKESIRSWVDDVVAKPLTPNLLGYVVPGALLKYDLPDLVRVIDSRKVKRQQKN